MRGIAALFVIGAVLCGTAVAAPSRTTFALPYDLVSAPKGTVLFLDRSRVLALRAGKLGVYARAGGTELVAMDRLADGTLFVADLPGGRVLRIDRARRARVVARIPEPADLVADATGSTLWVASIAPGVGVVRVDVPSGRVEPFAAVERPHGIDRDASGSFYVHDGHVVSRVDGTGAVSRFADVDAFKLVVGPGGAVYGVEGTPRGGRVVRIAPDGRVTRVAGTGRLGPHRDGPALKAGILPTSVALAPGGALLVSQLEPVPAIRRVDLATGRITTLARGR
jgi:sugar lactone lactonase YvrE